MNIENVTNKFKNISDISIQLSESIQNIISESFNKIQSLVKEDCDTPQNADVLENTAAALAFYKYKLMMQARENISDFKIGDVQVNAKSTVDSAYKLYISALEECAEFISDSNFVFERTC